MGIFIHSVDDSVTMESKRGERECVKLEKYEIHSMRAISCTADS
jgi:hypothetical protein